MLFISYYCFIGIHAFASSRLFLLYHDKRNRGFAAYEARQGGVMGFYESKKEVLSTAHAAVANTFEPKSIQKVSGLSNATLPTIPNHKIQQTQALVLRKAKQIKSMPLPSSRLSIAVFLSVAGYSPFSCYVS